jgi:uncharacterized protein (TIGR02300 family)
MSMKALRGTKRVCPNCSGKFYDLNRDPITCPICQSVFKAGDTTARPPAGNDIDQDDEVILDAGRGAVEFISLADVAPEEGDALPDIEGEDLVDVVEDDAAIDTAADEDEAFLESEDEGEADMSGFISGGSEGEDEI